MSKAKKKVILGFELIQALAGFKPSFGNLEDIAIIHKLGNFYKDLETVDNDVLRSNKKGSMLTPKMKDLLFTEKMLVGSITRRNMDF